MTAVSLDEGVEGSDTIRFILSVPALVASHEITKKRRMGKVSSARIAITLPEAQKTGQVVFHSDGMDATGHR